MVPDIIKFNLNCIHPSQYCTIRGNQLINIYWGGTTEKNLSDETTLRWSIFLNCWHMKKGDG